MAELKIREKSESPNVRAAPIVMVETPSSREGWRFGLFASHLLTLFGIALSNILLGAAILASPWLAERPALALRRGRRMLFLLALYVALLALSIVTSQDPRESFRSLSEVVTLATFPLALISVSGERRLRQLFDASMVVAALLALGGLAQFLAGYGSIDRRIRGPFSHVMTFSGVLLLIDLLLIARLVAPPPVLEAGKRWLDRPWVAWGCFLLINTALISTLTRNAWLGLCVGVGWLLWTRRRNWLLLAPAALFVVVLIAPVPVVARAISVTNLSDESTYDRLCMLQAGVRMVAEHPIVGLGPNMPERRYPIYRHPTASRLNVPHLHDSYLQLAAERGLPTLLVFLLLFAVALHAAWVDDRRAGGGTASDLRLGTIAALLAFLAAALFEHNWGDTEVQRMALLLLAAPFCLRPHAPLPESRDS